MFFVDAANVTQYTEEFILVLFNEFQIGFYIKF